MVTDKVGRLMAYTCGELNAYTCSSLNSLPYGISRILDAAQASAVARGKVITTVQDGLEKIPLVQYSALETAIENLRTATDDFWDSIK